MFRYKNGSRFFSSNKLRCIRIVPHGFSESPSKHSSKEYVSNKKCNTCLSTKRKAGGWGYQSPPDLTRSGCHTEVQQRADPASRGWPSMVSSSLED